MAISALRPVFFFCMPGETVPRRALNVFVWLRGDLVGLSKLSSTLDLSKVNVSLELSSFFLLVLTVIVFLRDITDLSLRKLGGGLFSVYLVRLSFNLI